MRISEAIFYNVMHKFAGLDVTELWRQRQLEDENQRLKRTGLYGGHCCKYKGVPA